jgi:hypothetical protein
MATPMTANQLERFAQAHRRVSRAEGEDVRSRRKLTWRLEDDKAFAFTGYLPPEAGAVVLQAIRAARSDLEHPHEEDGVSAETPAPPPAKVPDPPIWHPAYPGRCHLDDGPAGPRRSAARSRASATRARGPADAAARAGSGTGRGRTHSRGLADTVAHPVPSDQRKVSSCGAAGGPRAASMKIAVLDCWEVFAVAIEWTPGSPRRASLPRSLPGGAAGLSSATADAAGRRLRCC